ncbi:galactose oxidase/kelch, beta-propeller [Artemisia annua]|uniref:Galactose oxidase/kelch, beta-propeller n=1 Tax=Artemisia annua TaxID=35608 RepID=A0A2U1PTH8_ARTAN|nr:galactose oxidase/kelch, beta-propeller [Artemisia annua]
MSFLFYHHLLILFFFVLVHVAACAGGGSWSLLLPSVGISAMHMRLLPNDHVVMFDRTDFGRSNISLPNGQFRPNSTDCSAHSVEYDVGSNTIRPLMVLTDVMCSSGSLYPDGTLVQIGGWNGGYRVVRILKPCDNCDWQETPNGLSQQRWYATNHILLDGQQIIIGGRRAFSYEFYPKKSATEGVTRFLFLIQTNDAIIENNLYPFVFLNSDGNLFVFANNRAILFNYAKNQVVKTYPTMPGGHPRSYPSSGSTVLLPLRLKQRLVNAYEVLVCGGAPKDAYVNANNRIFDGALDTCGQIKISNKNPQWVMETMPIGRVMGDMLLLPNDHVLIINGASAGTAGWEFVRNPAISPVIYKPDNQIRSRFEVQNPSTKPRLYHSTAVLLRDGWVLVGGSNLHSRRVTVTFTVTNPVDLKSVFVTMVAPSFKTHAFSMNQRLLVLDTANSAKAIGNSTYQVGAIAPPSGNIAPA